MTKILPQSPRILTTTVGSYSQIDWLQAGSSEQSVVDATQIVINTQRRLGIDLPTDGELYRLILELAHRPKHYLAALSQIDKRIGIGIGVIDVKVNHVETPDEVAGRIEVAEKRLGEGRVKWVHPDCGFWMLKRSIADRKIETLVKGRDKYLGL